MLSIENSSDPSCSSSKASDLAVISGDEAQPQLLAPKFSIRDYVFRTRSKDIRINWPFREPLLQLCLDNGITDLLPPLQSRSVVKSHCVENKSVLANGGPNVDVELESSLPLDSSVSVPKEKRKFKVKLIQSESENNASSLTSNIESSEETLGDQPIKNKCRLAEEYLVSNSSTVSDPMGSKICPVCKLFASSSNTTLNAHIDQCLSSEQYSNATKDVARFFKPKVKPRKKRLMVDIYTTAPRCTLEELDRRNGSTWAVSLAVVAPPASEANLETKRPNLSPLDVGCEGNVGDIYVDSNGTKLLILSKFDDSHPPVSRKSFKLKKHGKGCTASPSNSMTTKNILKPRCSKPVRDNPQSRNSSPAEAFKGEIVAATEIEHCMDAHHEKEGSLTHLLNARDRVNNGVPSALGHWVCSKRSNLTRKLGNNDANKGSENMIATARKLSFEHTQTDEGHSSIERPCASNLPSSSEAVALPKFKGLNNLSQSLKKCKLLGEGDCSDAPPQPSSPDDRYHPSLKGRKSFVSKKSGLSSRMCMSLEGMKVDGHERVITPKKFKKRRSILACSKWGEGERNSDANGANCDFTEDIDLISSGADETSKIHPSNLSENQEEGCLVMKDSMRSFGLEQVESISRDEIRVESPTQRSKDTQEMQREDTIRNVVISREIEISVDRTEPTVQNEEIQERNPCFTGGGMGLESTQETTSTTSIRVKPNEDHNTILDMEVSGCSEVSNTSAISPPSPMHDYSKDLKAEPLSSLIARKDNKVLLSPSPRESSCSCSESLSRESQLSSQTGRITASNMFMKHPTLDSSKPCAQPASNPVLRLMGKDLVVSKEECVQMPNILPRSTNYTPEPKFIAFGIPHNVGFIGYNNYYNYQMPTLGNHQFPNSPLTFAQQQHRQPKPTLSSNQAREVIVIDDDSHGVDAEPRTNSTASPSQSVQNSNIMAPQRLFTCIPPQNPYASRAFTSNRRGTPEGPFIFPSASSLYFTPSLR